VIVLESQSQPAIDTWYRLNVLLRLEAAAESRCAPAETHPRDNIGMKALIATDGSSHSLRAARFLIAWMKQCGTIEVHVVNVQPRAPYIGLLPAERRADIERLIQQRGTEESAAVCEMLSAAGVPYSLHVVSDDAAEAIARCAREQQCELIVMGTRGMGAVAGLALGSVATKVLHLAVVPVTLVK